NSRGKLDEAERLVRKAIGLERKLHGQEHPHVAQALLRLAGILSGRARGVYSAEMVAEAEATYRSVLAMQRRVESAGSIELVDTLVSLAEFINAYGGRHIEAEALI